MQNGVTTTLTFLTSSTPLKCLVVSTPIIFDIAVYITFSNYKFTITYQYEISVVARSRKCYWGVSWLFCVFSGWEMNSRVLDVQTVRRLSIYGEGL